MENKKYIGQFAGQEIQADSKKEYIISALQNFINKIKSLIRLVEWGLMWIILLKIFLMIRI